MQTGGSAQSRLGCDWALQFDAWKPHKAPCPTPPAMPPPLSPPIAKSAKIVWGGAAAQIKTVSCVRLACSPAASTSDTCW